MAKYLVRCEATLEAVVEADSEDDAIEKAPALDSPGWDNSDAEYEAVELDEVGHTKEKD
jgi:hypothetical protein